HDNRYTIIRKLGCGSTSSTWLVHDTRSLRFFSFFPSRLLSLEFLRDIAKRAGECDDKDDDEGCEGFEHVPILLDHFTVTVTGHGRDRRHLCFVQNLYSTSVSALRNSSPTNSLPVYMIRHLIYMVLQGLTALHSLNIIHTMETLENGLPKSQPIPHRWTYNNSAYETELISATLVDLGHAQRAGEQLSTVTDLFTTPALQVRAPELILQSDFSPAVDIWVIGCLAFVLLVGNSLFPPEGREPDWSVEDNHLAKMLELTGQQWFPPAMLARAKNRDKYFDKDGE
ncbi:kinase-like domain-containing protein, partial [Lentinula edodes]